VSSPWAPTFRVYLAFLLPLTLPATVRMFYEVHPAALWMCALQLAFVAVLVAAALQLRAKLQQMLRLAGSRRRAHARA